MDLSDLGRTTGWLGRIVINRRGQPVFGPVAASYASEDPVTQLRTHSITVPSN